MLLLLFIIFVVPSWFPLLMLLIGIIFLLFLLESTIIGFLGGVIGIGIGVAIGVIMNLTLNALAAQFGGVAVSLLAFPIGFVLSYVIMATLYFLIIGPIAVIRRVFGRDAMHRSYDSSASSYWTQARPPRDKENYFHQF